MAAGGVLVGRGYVSIRPEFEGDWSRSVNTRASSAGRSGASAFSKAFGVGLKSIGALAGVAIGANLSTAAAGAAALAPALATAGAAAGALKLGLSGVGDAFKAAFADHTAEARAAAAATRAVESAQRGLAKAQQGLADARVQAAERVKEAQRAVADAEQNLAQTVEESAQRQADAQQQVADAERQLRSAQQDALQAQQALNGAREEATRALEDMNTRLKESRLDEKDAALRLTDAQKALAAARANPGTTPEQLAKLQLAYDRAKLNLQEQRTETRRLSEDTRKANKAGVEGSQQVTQAKQRIADANQTVADRERALAKAQEDARRTAVDGARQVADAQQKLADAQAGVVKARQEGARQIRDAEQAVADASQAVADAQAAAASQTSKFDQAMAKLAPNARSFVKTVQGLAPAWNSMRLSVQNRLFKGLDTTVTGLAHSTIPILKEQLTATAGIWNTIAKNAAAGVHEMAKSGTLKDILKGANDNLRAFQNTPKQLITAFGQLTVAAQPAFNGLLQQFAGAITRFTDGIAASFKSGGLQDAINTAFGILQSFGTVLGNALGVVVQISKAASDAGGQIVGVLGSVFGELKKILAAPEMQAQLRNLFAAVAQIVSAIVPVIGTVVQAAVPLVAALAPIVAQLAQTLGPVLQQVVTALGQALMPIITALGPVITVIGDAIGQIVTALVPLLQPIGQLIAAIITALLPVLKPVVDIIVQLVDVLVGPLTQIVQAVIPPIQLLGTLFGQVFGALAPIITPLVGVIGQLAAVFARVATLLIGTLMQALTPLIPVFVQIANLIVQLATQVLAALMPSLNQLIAAQMQLFQALLPILPQLVQLTALLLTLAVDVLSVVLPPLIRLAGFLVGQLVTGLVTVIRWVTSLVNWLTKNLGPAFTTLRDKGTAAWSKLQSGIATSWGLIKSNVLYPIRDFFTKSIPGWATTAKNRTVGAFDGARDGLSTAWGSIKAHVLYPFRDFFTKSIPGWATTFKDKVVGAFGEAKDGIKTAWSKIRSATKDPINFVIGTIWNRGLVDTVWKKITDWIPGLPKLGHIPLLAQGGMLPVAPGVFNQPTAIVGEGDPRYPEYVIPTDPRYRKRALALHAAAGTQLLAGGGILGDIVGGIKNIGGKIGGVLGGAVKFLRDPGKALESLLGKLLKPLDGIKGSAWGKLAIALPKSIFEGLKGLVGFGGGGGGGDIGGTIPKGQRLAIISQALAAAGAPPPGTLPQWQAGLNTLITRESGWNPNAINRWDSNAKAGHPSQGLAQTIPGTFNAYVPASLRGRGILDPVANVAAAIRYIVSRYGNITNVQQANANRPPAGYDSGGWLQPGYTLAYNGTGRPEPVLTGAQWNAVMAGSQGAASFEGNLYLDSGEFLGRVRGEAEQIMQAGQQRLISVLNAT